jgi:hypothetical protein
VVDTGGGVIPNAHLLLIEHGEAVVERLESDSAGRFASPHSLIGTYELVVSGAGFTPLRTTVHAVASGSSPRLSRLTVQLGASGLCSTAYAK